MELFVVANVHTPQCGVRWCKDEMMQTLNQNLELGGTALAMLALYYKQFNSGSHLGPQVNKRPLYVALLKKKKKKAIHKKFTIFFITV